MKKILCFIIIFTYSTIFGGNTTTTVEVFGESKIINNDVPSAKLEAILRAKWLALEKSSQINIKFSSLLYNSEIIDEAIKSEVNGIITNFTILDEGKDKDKYWIKSKVTIIPQQVDRIIDTLKLNKNIAVYIPLLDTNKSIVEEHIFKDQLISELEDLGFNVLDIAQADTLLASKLARAITNNDMGIIRELSSTIISNTLLIGTIKTKLNNTNIGYLIELNFKSIDGNLNYRLINNTDTNKKVITTGNIIARGLGNSIKSAEENLLENMSESDAILLANIASEKIIGINKKIVKITISGNNDPRTLITLKSHIKNISWVLSVREVGNDTIFVEYPEKTSYLAAMIAKSTGFIVREFSDNEIILSGRSL